MPSSPRLCPQVVAGQPAPFWRKTSDKRPTSTKRSIFGGFHGVRRGGGENADRAPEMDIQFAFPFRARAGFEWPEGPFLCLNSWFEDVFMV